MNDENYTKFLETFLLETLCRYVFPDTFPTLLGMDLTGAYTVIGFISGVLSWYFLAVCIYTIFSGKKST